MLVKNKDVLLMREVINKVATKDIGKVKFRWGISKNLDIIEKEYEIIDKFRKPSKEFAEWEKKREEVVQKFAQTDENGNYKIDDRLRQYVVLPAERDNLEEALVPVKEDFKEAIEKRDKQLEDFAELLEDETDIEFYKVSTEHIPDELLAFEMKALMPIWLDEEDNVTNISTKRKKTAKKKAKNG